MSKINRLTELEFSDLYLGKNYAKVKNLKGASSLLVDITKEYKAELDSLRRTCRLTYSDGQDPEFSLEIDGLMYRVVMVREVNGDELFVLRKFTASLRKPAQIGYPPALIRSLLDKDLDSGMILVVGPTGAGKTTSIVSLMIERLIRFGGVAVTVEDPPELAISGDHGESGYCVQIRASRKTGGFGEALTRALRMAPNIIMVGEVRERIGATQAANAALNGHLVFCTTHSDSVINGIKRVIDFVAQQSKDEKAAANTLAQGLKFVIYQSLIKNKDGTSKLKFEMLNLCDKDSEQSIRSKIANGNLRSLVQEVTLQMRRLDLDPSGTRNFS